jgi:hypothetical protein
MRRNLVFMPSFIAGALIVSLIAVFSGLGINSIAAGGELSDHLESPEGKPELHKMLREFEREDIDAVKHYRVGCHTIAQGIGRMKGGFEADGMHYRDLGWTAKEQDGPTPVSYRFSLNGRVRIAQWNYDHVYRELLPLNQDARMIGMHAWPCADR